MGKLDKMQQSNHAKMQTLDVRMQQMMGMFQMFMMNQTIGMNQMQQQQQQNNDNNDQHHPQSDNPSDDSSQIVLKFDKSKLGVAAKTITKSRSQGNLESKNQRHRVRLKKHRLKKDRKRDKKKRKHKKSHRDKKDRKKKKKPPQKKKKKKKKKS